MLIWKSHVFVSLSVTVKLGMIKKEMWYLSCNTFARNNFENSKLKQNLYFHVVTVTASEVSCVEEIYGDPRAGTR